MAVASRRVLPHAVAVQAVPRAVVAMVRRRVVRAGDVVIRAKVIRKRLRTEAQAAGARAAVWASEGGTSVLAVCVPDQTH